MITEGAPRRSGEAPVEYVYRADQKSAVDGYRWKPAIYMPRAACRLVLDVVSVRVERLQDISGDDAMAEGVTLAPLTGTETAARIAYFQLWDSINGKDAASKNPWVWVIEFKRSGS